MSSDGNTSKVTPPLDLRQAMPLTAAWVAQMRGRLGAKWVNACVKQAFGGERNQFYAIEAGHIVGQPFDFTERQAYVVSMSILTGARFVAALASPDGIVDLGVLPAEPAPPPAPARMSPSPAGVAQHGAH